MENKPRKIAEAAAAYFDAADDVEFIQNLIKDIEVATRDSYHSGLSDQKENDRRNVAAVDRPDDGEVNPEQEKRAADRLGRGLSYFNNAF